MLKHQMKGVMLSIFRYYVSLPWLRMSILTVAIIAILFVRIHLIGGGTPEFIDSDNPASFSPHFQTRFLTYSYLCAVNVWLLLNPSNLCHDWSMGSIPLIHSIADIRNIATLSLALSLCLLSLRGEWSLSVT